jgi:hypothetical protein
MLSHDGVAAAEFTQVRGDGYVNLLLVREDLDLARGVQAQDRYGVMVRMTDGDVWLDDERLRPSIPGFGRMDPGARVRVEFVDATRMFRVVYRGETIDICVLPADCDVAHMRFGTVLSNSNAVYITGSSV